MREGIIFKSYISSEILLYTVYFLIFISINVPLTMTHLLCKVCLYLSRFNFQNKEEKLNSKYAISKNNAQEDHPLN